MTTNKIIVSVFVLASLISPSLLAEKSKEDKGEVSLSPQLPSDQLSLIQEAVNTPLASEYLFFAHPDERQSTFLRCVRRGLRSQLG